MEIIYFYVAVLNNNFLWVICDDSFPTARIILKFHFEIIFRENNEHFKGNYEVTMVQAQLCSIYVTWSLWVKNKKREENWDRKETDKQYFPSY